MGTMMPVGERVYLPGTVGYDGDVGNGRPMGGVIEGYAIKSGPGGADTYYVVQLDQRDQGWLQRDRTYIGSIIVHPDNVKAGVLHDVGS